MQALKQLESFILHLGILIIRITVTVIGLIELFLGIVGFWGGDLRYLGNIVLGGIFLWPFRRIRNLVFLHKYYVLLFLNTALFIIYSALSIGSIPGATIMWGSYLFNGLALILNIVVVEKYVEYKAGTTTWSPFFSGKAILRLILAVLAILTIGFAYIFVGKHETARGTSWLWSGGVSVLLPFSGINSWAEAIMTKETFRQPYTIESEGISTTASMSAVVVQMTIPLDSTGSAMVVAMPGTSVVLTFGPQQGLEKLVLKGRDEGPIAPDDKRSWWLDESGRFMNLAKWKDKWVASPTAPYEVWFQTGYVRGDETFTHNGYVQGDSLRINIEKLLVKPEPWLGQMPIYRVRLPWKLEVQWNDQKPVTVVDGIEAWYR